MLLIGCSTRLVETVRYTHTITMNTSYTVEPLNNGHVWKQLFVLYREVVLSSEVKMYFNSSSPRGSTTLAEPGTPDVTGMRAPLLSLMLGIT